MPQTLAGADWRDDGDLVTFLDGLGTVVAFGWNVYVFEVDSNEARLQDLGLHSLVFFFQEPKELLQWQRSGKGFEGLAGVRTRAGEVEDVEVPLGRPRNRSHRGRVSMQILRQKDAS